MSLLSMENLLVQFDTTDGLITAVDNLSFSVAQGEILGLVGESGSGKSMTACSLIGLLPKSAQVSGQAYYHQQDLLSLSERELNRIRFEKISMVFQNPMTSLNPYMKIGPQLSEVLELHKSMSRKQARLESEQMLNAVKIPQSRQRMNMYPHELSGGMRQRVMIAMALLCKPDLLIADEPTTALDVTVQAQIIGLLQELREEFGIAILMITHDLPLVAQFCDRVLVMRNGQSVECATTTQLFHNTQHSYTKSLLAAIPGRSRQ